jgi:nucleoside recognition membrane protein YjiH
MDSTERDACALLLMSLIGILCAIVMIVMNSPRLPGPCCHNVVYKGD